MSAQPSQSGDTAVDRASTVGKLAELTNRRKAAENAGSEKAIAKQHAKGKMTARERVLLLLDDDSFVELDSWPATARTPSGSRRPVPTETASSPATAPSTADRSCLLPGLHRFRRFLGEVFGEKIVKVMDLAMKTGVPVIGINDSGGAHPGRSGLARSLRRDLPSQRPLLRCDPADLADHGTVRRWCRLLAGRDRLHRDGRQDLPHVHHRPGRHQDRHRGGCRVRGARRRPPTTPSPGSPTTWERTRTTPWSTSSPCCPSCRATTWRCRRRSMWRWTSASRRTTWPSTRSSRTRPTSPTTCIRSSRVSSTTATFSRSSRCSRPT